MSSSVSVGELDMDDWNGWRRQLCLFVFRENVEIGGHCQSTGLYDYL